MSPANRQYSYRVSWRLTLTLLFVAGPLAVFLGYLAASGYSFAEIKNGATKPPSGSDTWGNLKAWGACLFLAILALVGAVLGLLQRLRGSRLSLTPAGIILPRHPWTSVEKLIEFKNIRALVLSIEPGDHVLRVFHAHGEDRLLEGHMESPAKFTELAHLLDLSVQQSGKGEHKNETSSMLVNETGEPDPGEFSIPTKRIPQVCCPVSAHHLLMTFTKIGFGIVAWVATLVFLFEQVNLRNQNLAVCLAVLLAVIFGATIPAIACWLVPSLGFGASCRHDADDAS